MHAVKKLDALTSLRFFAAAMIVVGHGHRLFGSLGIANTLSLAQGVSFFFVLSGFILAYNYPVLSSWESVARFLKARFARIWPAHVAAIFLMLFLTGDLNSSASSLSGAIFAGVMNLLLIQSAVPFKSIFLSFNGVAWSISTEMFFYLAFPLLIGGVMAGWKRKLALLTGVVVLYVWFAVLWKVPVDESLPQLNLMGLLYVNPLVRVLEFFIGVMTCRAFLHLRSLGVDQKISVPVFTALEVSVLVLVVASMWFTPKIRELFSWWGDLAAVVHFYSSKSGSAGVFALLILVFAWGRGALARALLWWPLVRLGEISFSLYLVHTSVLGWYENNIEHFSTLPPWSMAFVFWALSLCVAWLLHTLVESPFRKIILSPSAVASLDTVKTLFASRQLVALTGGVVLLVLMQCGPASLMMSECEKSSVCVQIIKRSSMAVPVDFNGYASLVGLRVQPAENRLQFVELVFRLQHPIHGYKLAIHVLDKDSVILGQSDSLINIPNVDVGGLWIERVTLPIAFTSSQAVSLGLAVYKYPSSLLSVTYPATDYKGHRALLNFEKLGLKTVSH